MSYYLHESADDIAILLSDQGQVVAIFPSRREAEDEILELDGCMMIPEGETDAAA